MPGGGGELQVQLRLHPKRWWLLVPLEVSIGVDETITLDMVLDTGSPLSAISEPVRNILSTRGCLIPVGKNWYLLRDLTIQGQKAVDLRVHISQRATKVGVDGVLGLDFLAQFSQIHFDIRSLQLTLKF